jgi:hypothetical protein
MKRRTTIIRVALSTAIFLGLQAGLCVAACGMAAAQPASAEASAMPSCHASAPAAPSETDGHERADGVRSGATDDVSCCATWQNTSPADVASIASPLLLAAQVTPGHRATPRPAAFGRIGPQHRKVPPPNILLLKSTLLL